MPWDQVMHKWGPGNLKSGGSGQPVKSQKQAVAIMLSEKRKAQGGNKEYQSKKNPLDKAMSKVGSGY
jgi:hypothetical protein